MTTKPAARDQDPSTGSSAPPQQSPQRVVVTAQNPSTYDDHEHVQAGRTDAPLDEQPYSIRVITEQVIRDTNALDLDDITRFAAGVANENIGGFLGANDTAFLRGFRTRFLYYDSFFVEALPSVNPSTLSRVEVLRGPSGVLFGSMDPGGAINLVPKGASQDGFVSLRERFGSWNFVETTFDAGGALFGSRQLSVRVNGGARSNESFRDYFSDQRQWLDADVRWQPSEDLTITAHVGYGAQKRVIDEGVAFTSTGGRVAPRNLFLGEPGFPGQRYHSVLSELRLDWRLADGVRFQSGFLASNWANDMHGVRRSAQTQANGTVNRLFDDSDFEQDSYQWTNQLIWNVDAGGMQHELRAGLDLRYRSSDLWIRRGSFPGTSITDPTYGNPEPALTTIAPSEQNQDWTSVFLQDQFDAFDDDLHANVAARYDHIQQENSSGGNPGNEGSDAAITFRAGALYDLTEQIGVFASFGQSFLPQSPGTNDVAGNRLDPERGTQYELGLKASWFEEQLWTTVSVYELTKDHVAIGDVNNPGSSIDAGELRSRGVEFEASGAVTKRLAVIGSYAYTDTKVLASTTLPVGASFRNIPGNSGNLWVKYTFDSGPLDGFGAGAGMRAVGYSNGDDAASFRLPGYVTFDCGLFYRTTLRETVPVDMQLNVVNLLDETYYESSLANSRVFPGSPRALYASVGVTF